MTNQSILLTKVVAEDLDVGVARVEVPAPSGGYVVGNQINLSTLAMLYQGSWTPGTVAAAGLATTSVTVAGAALGFPVLVGLSSLSGSDAYELVGRVSAANTVTVDLYNNTVGSVAFSAGTLSVLVFPIPGV